MIIKITFNKYGYAVFGQLEYLTTEVSVEDDGYLSFYQDGIQYAPVSWVEKIELVKAIKIF